VTGIASVVFQENKKVGFLKNYFKVAQALVAFGAAQGG
jgi:hypothetical protein